MRLWSRLNRLWTGDGDVDEDFVARCGKLRHELDRSEARAPDEVRRLRSIVDSLPHRLPTPPEALNGLRKVEAELYQLVPPELLYSKSLDLRRRLYRLPKGIRDKWEADLLRMMPDETTIVDEQTCRTRLEHLVHTLYSAGTNFTRQLLNRSLLVRNLTGFAILTIALLLLFVYFVWPSGNESSPPWELGRMLVLVALIGGVAASISASRAIVQHEKLRLSMQGLLFSELLLRTVLGSMSAGFIYLMVSSGAITFGLAGTSHAEGHRFFLALAFASGFSDRLLVQALKPFITGK